jgi:hypothetical protein
MVYETTASGQRSCPYGDHPDGYLGYFPDGRMYAIGVTDDRLEPRGLVPTDEEKIKLQGSMFAYAGTYTADGHKVVHHVDISWNQFWTGTDLVRFYKLDGNTLTITTAPVPSTIDGKEGHWILVWKKYNRKPEHIPRYAAILADLVSVVAHLRRLRCLLNGASSGESHCEFRSAKRRSNGVSLLWRKY